MAGVEAFMTELERFRGQDYVYAAEIPTSADPTGVGSVDCSELTSVAARRVGVNLPDGAYNQCVMVEQAGLLRSADEAIMHRGNLIFYDDGSGSGRDRVTHVAVSTGDGATTYEARNEGYVVGVQPYAGRKFTTGGPVPGIHYAPVPVSHPMKEGDMLVQHANSGTVYLLSGGRLVAVRNGESLPGLTAVLGPVAVVDAGTWDAMKAAYGEPV